jgi:hypothetical protein
MQKAVLQFLDMRQIGLFLLIVFPLWMTACSSAQKKTEPVQKNVEKAEAPKVSVGAGEEEAESVDVVALQRALGLERPATQLGYAERAFNTCEVGYGFSKSHNCRQRYMVVVHFQMMCRNSEGTVSEIVRPADLQPNSNRNVRWSLKNESGATTTDYEGMSQVRLISAQSQKQQRFKLTVESDFLYLRAGEVNRIVTPRSWCR